jgi:hypothetical protein
MSLKCKDNKALSKELELQNIPNTYGFDKTSTPFTLTGSCSILYGFERFCMDLDAPSAGL